MNLRLTSAALALGVVGLASVQAQTLNIPTFYIWGEYPADTNVIYTPTTTKVRKIVQVNLNACDEPQQGGNCGGTLYYNWPELVAQRVATEVHAEIGTNGRLTNETVTVLIQNFGYDSAACDAPPGQAESDLGGARFFLSSDRLPGIGEFSLDPEPRFPIRRTEAGWNNRYTLDYGYARSYRHPFLANGKDGAPLKAWFQRFVDRLDLVWEARNATSDPNDDIPHPNTYRYYFDVEPLFAHEAGENGVWFLDYLADPGFYGHPQYNYWNPTDPASPYRVPELVPGQGTKTLQDCYNDYRIANGYNDWPVDNPSGQLALNNNFNYHAPQNAPFLAWYSELCVDVRDAVLTRCFHQVLRDKWPGSGVKSGNYGDYSADGQPDIFGWEGDRPWDTDLATSNNNPPSWSPRELGGRFARHKARGGPRNYLSPYLNDPSSQRMLDIVQKMSGATDSPVAYAFGYYELEPLFGQPGWRRPDLFEAGHPNEEDVEAAIRFHRHTAESILNTPGTGLVNAERNLSPWLTMPRAEENDSVPGQFEAAFTSRRNTRALMGMFRGKNIKEGMFWTNWFITRNEEQDPPRSESITQLLNAWEQTQRSVVEVYSTKVKKYTRTFAQNPGSPAYEDVNETPEQKASRLEFTLRQFPQTPRSEREVRLNAKPLYTTLPTGGQQLIYQTVMTVDLDWIDLTYAGTPEGNYADSRTKAEINIECSIEFPGVNSGHVTDWQDIGRVQVWSASQAKYIEIGTGYTFNAPISNEPVTGDKRWRMRLQVVVDPALSIQYVFPDTMAANAPRTRMRLIHQSPIAFISRYDLVQFIPTDEVYSQQSQSLMANSDMNHDGSVDTLDLSIYLDEWMSDSPAADFDANSAVTGSDADAFVEAYVNGT